MSSNCRFSTGWFGKGPSTDNAGDFTAGTSEYDLFVFAVIALYAQEPALWSLGIVYHIILLLELELLCPETWSLVSFLTNCATVSEPDAFCGFVATGHLGEFSAVSYALLSILLSCNVSHG